jgi:membrane fusion protein, adhesin transport system
MISTGSRLLAFGSRRRRPPRSTSVQEFAGSANLLEEQWLPRFTGWLALGLGGLMVATLVWAVKTPLSEVMVAKGVVWITEPLRPVTLPEGGKIADVLASSGGAVKAGAPILRLDYQAQLNKRDALLERVQALSMDEERLSALLEGRTPDFAALSGATAAAISAQTALFGAERSVQESRRAVLESRLSIASLEIASHRRLLLDAQLRREDARNERNRRGISPIDTTVPWPRAIGIDLSEDDARTEIESVLHGEQVLRLHVALDDIRAQLELLEVESRAEAMRQHIAVVNDIEALTAEAAELTARLAGAWVIAPVDGMIVMGRDTVVGSHLGPGTEIAYMLPATAELYVEISGLPDDDSVEIAGREARVRIPELGPSDLALHQGRIEVVAEHDGRGMNMMVALSHSDRLFDSALPLLPGMTVEIEILGAPRSLLSHLLAPFRRLKAPLS